MIAFGEKRVESISQLRDSGVKSPFAAVWQKVESIWK